jgi:hypothetical protein
VEIVEQPGVEAIGGECCLNAAEVKFGCCLRHWASIAWPTVSTGRASFKQTAGQSE